LPLTGKGVVDMLIIDLGVFEIDETGMTLTELAPGVTLAEIAERTDARYKVVSALQGR
jgi:3-oxoacid CoA-transferase subunit B